MQRTARAITTLTLIALVLAACARTGTGGGGAPSSGLPEASGSTSMPAASGNATAKQRVDIGALAAGPDGFEGQDVTVLARVDKVLVDGTAFLTSPSATDEDQFAVVVKPDAQVDKELAVGTVVWVDGTLVGFDAQHLSDAGVDVTPDQLAGFDGEWVLIADAIRDPLTTDR